MIETQQALDNLDEILKVDSLDSIESAPPTLASRSGISRWRTRRRRR